MEIDRIINILLEEHRDYCITMVQKCENVKDFRDFFVRADTVRVIINNIIKKSFSNEEMRRKYKEKVKKRIDNICELIFLEGNK